MDYRKRMRDLREDNDLTQEQVGKILNKSRQGFMRVVFRERKTNPVFFKYPIDFSVIKW